MRSFLGAVSLAAMMAVGAADAAQLNLHNGGDVASLDPQRMSGDWEDRVAGDIFEGLTTEDAKAEPVAGQAESWTISPDGLVYTFKLRPGIKW